MVICSICNSHNTSIRKNGTEDWRNYKDTKICNKCYMKYIANPKRPKGFSKKYNDRKTPEQRKKYNKKWNPIISKRRLQFKTKSILLKENPRKGICSECGKKIGDFYVDRRLKIRPIKITHIHHIQYNENDPLKDTKELCAACHIKESKKEVVII